MELSKNTERRMNDDKDECCSSDMCSQPCLEVGTSYEVFISNLQGGPTSFYIQCVKDFQQLGNIMQCLNSVPLEPLKMPPHIGLPCASKFQNKTLSRAVISSTTTENYCEVLFVDFGVRMRVPNHELYYLPEQLAKSPMSLAIRFKLNDIEHITTNINKANNMFTELVKNKYLRLEVLSIEKDIQCCELYDGNIKISDVLKKQLEIVVVYPAMSLPNNVSLRVSVSSIVTSGVVPWSFSVNLVSNLPEMEELSVQINQYCEANASTVQEVISAKKNQPILAQSSKDRLWYRAKIIENYNGKSAYVHFVDCGNSEEVHPSSIMPAPVEIINHFPPQAIHCRLQYADMLPLVASRLSQITYYKALDMHITQLLPTGECIVRLFDTSVAPSKDISEYLLAYHSSIQMNYPRPPTAATSYAPSVNDQTQAMNQHVMPAYSPGLSAGPCTVAPPSNMYSGGVPIARRIRRPVIITAPPAVKTKDDDKIDGSVKARDPTPHVQTHTSATKHQIEDSDVDTNKEAKGRESFDSWRAVEPDQPRDYKDKEVEKRQVVHEQEIDSSTHLYPKDNENKLVKSEFVSWINKNKTEHVVANDTKLGDHDETKQRDNKNTRFEDESRDFGKPKFETERGDNKFVNIKDESLDRGFNYQRDGNLRRKVSSQRDGNEGKERRFGNQKNENQHRDFSNRRYENDQGREKEFGISEDRNKGFGRRDSHGNMRSSMTPGNSNARGESRQHDIPFNHGNMRSSMTPGNCNARGESRQHDIPFNHGNMRSSMTPGNSNARGESRQHDIPFNHGNMRSSMTPGNSNARGESRQHDIPFNHGNMRSSMTPWNSNARGESRKHDIPFNHGNMRSSMTPWNSNARGESRQHDIPFNHGNMRSSMTPWNSNARGESRQHDIPFNHGNMRSSMTPGNSNARGESRQHDIPFNHGNMRSSMTPGNSNARGESRKQENSGTDHGKNNTQDRGSRFYERRNTSEIKCTVFHEVNWEEALSLLKPMASLKYSQQNLEVGEEIEATHVYANNPLDFFIQPISSACQLKDVMSKIDTFCNGNVDVPVQFIVGDSCIAQFSEDFIWYRAKVLSIQDNQCEVQFVDYGNTSSVDIILQMKSISSDLVQLPAQAIRCALRGVTAEKEWTLEEVVDFASLMEADTVKATLVGLDSVDPKKYSVVVHQGDVCINEQYGANPTSLLPRTQVAKSVLKVGDSCEVTISWFFTPHNFHVHLQLSKKQRGVLANTLRSLETPILHNVATGAIAIAVKDSVPFRATVLATRDIKARVINIDVGNVSIVELNQLKIMPESMMDTPAFAVPCTLSEISPVSGPEWDKNCNITKSVFQSSSVFTMTVVSIDENAKLHVKLEAAGTDVATQLVQLGVAVFQNAHVEAVPDSTPASELLQSPPDEPIQQQDVVSLEHDPAVTISQQQVFVSYAKDLYLFVHLASLTDKLDSMQEDLQLAMQVEQLALQSGDSSLVAAKNLEDNIWYRAQLLSTINEDKAETQVFFIDYGNEDTVIEIKQLPPQFCNFPPFALSCILPLTPVNKEESNNQVLYNKIQDILYDTSIIFTLKKYITQDDKLVIDLFYNNKSLIDTLVQANIATSLVQHVYVSTITESEINIQLLKDEITIHEIEEKLIQVQSLKDILTVNIGEIYIAKFTDDCQWYRVNILESTEGGYIANFIDYGNTAVVTEIKQLPQDLADIPPLSQLCVITNVEEMDCLVEAASTGSTIQVLMSRTEETPLKITIIKDSSIKDTKHSQELQDVCDERKAQINTTPVGDSDCIIQQNKTLADLLLSALLKFEAKQSKEDITSEGMMITEESNKEGLKESAHIDEIHNLSQKTGEGCFEENDDGISNIKPTVLQIQDQREEFDENKGIKLFNSEDIELDPSTAQIETGVSINTIVNKDTTVENNVVSTENLSPAVQEKEETESISTENKPVAESTVKLTSIRIIKYLSPEEFWCHKIEDLNKLKIINTLISNLNSKLLINTEVDKLYASQSNINNQWYRAVKLDENHVRFIDYGRLESTTIFKQLPRDISNIPPLATLYHYDIALVNPVCHDKLNYVLSESNAIFEAAIVDNIILSLYKDGENIIDILNKKELSEICISYFNKFDNFYIHEIKDLFEIAELSDNIQNTSSDKIEVVEIGMRCLAKYEMDNNSWQRVDIISSESNNTYTVFLIDYGNLINASEFKKIPDHMIDIPPMAKQCHLTIIPSDEFIQFQLSYLLSHSNLNIFDVDLSGYVQGTSLGITLYEGGENIIDKLTISYNKKISFDGETSGGILTTQLDIQKDDNTEFSTEEVQNTEVSTEEVQNTKVSAEEVQNTEFSTEEVQNTEVSTVEDQNTEVSTEEVQNTEVSTEEVQNTEVSTEEVQNTEVSTEEVQNTEVSTVEDQNTEVSAQSVYKIKVPALESQNSAIPAEKSQNTKVSVEKQDTEVSAEEENTEILSTNENESEPKVKESINNDENVPETSHFDIKNVAIGSNTEGTKQEEKEILQLCAKKESNVNSKEVDKTKENVEESSVCNISDCSSDSSKMEVVLYKNTQDESLNKIYTEVKLSNESKVEIPSLNLQNSSIFEEENKNESLTSEEITRNKIDQNIFPTFVHLLSETELNDNKTDIEKTFQSANEESKETITTASFKTAEDSHFKCLNKREEIPFVELTSEVKKDTNEDKEVTQKEMQTWTLIPTSSEVEFVLLDVLNKILDTMSAEACEVAKDKKFNFFNFSCDPYSIPLPSSDEDSEFEDYKQDDVNQSCDESTSDNSNTFSYQLNNKSLKQDELVQPEEKIDCSTGVDVKGDFVDTSIESIIMKEETTAVSHEEKVPVKSTSELILTEENTVFISNENLPLKTSEELELIAQAEEKCENILTVCDVEEKGSPINADDLKTAEINTAVISSEYFPVKIIGESESTVCLQTEETTANISPVCAEENDSVKFTDELKTSVEKCGNIEVKSTETVKNEEIKPEDNSTKEENTDEVEKQGDILTKEN